MEWKIAGSVIVVLIIACAALYAMHRKDVEENTALKTALASQSALLSETQAELQLRDAVISKRDAEIAEADRKREQAENKYAKLVRTSKVVRDWDVVLLPDDVNGLLKAASTDSAAVSSGDADNGGGHP